MKILLSIALLLGSSFALPSRLSSGGSSRGGSSSRGETGGYDYQPPVQPPDLYRTPSSTTPRPTRPPPPPPTRPPPPPPTRPPPPPPTPSYLPPNPSEHIPSIAAPPNGMMLMPYEFAYNVDDAESGVQFRHEATSDGQHVTGEYSVMLPDGRLQVVKFASDPENGYTADVSYQ